jgi:hypothetical protein
MEVTTMKTILYSATLFFTFLANGCGPTTTDGYAPPPFPLHTDTQTITLLLDKTGSSSEENTPRFAANVKKAVEDSDEPWEIDVVGMGANGKGPLDARTDNIKIGGAPIYQFDADAVGKEAHGKCWGKKPCINKKVKYAEEVTKKEYAKALSIYETTKKEGIAKLVDAINSPATAEPACSDIQEMAERAMVSKGGVIWITDAVHNCRDTFTGLALKETILVGLAPLKNEEPGEFIKRLRAMSEKLETENVKPTAMLDADAINSFLTTSRERLLAQAQGGAK